MTQPFPDRRNKCPFGTPYQKYWDKLSEIERRMELDVQGLYSLDRQDLALALARKIQAPRVIDAFCGVGGAAIAFARVGKIVDAMDIDEARLAMARRNAALFSVQDRIRFREGDAMELMRPSDAALYLDPPWGGPEYGRLERFSLAMFRPDGERLLRKALAVSREVFFKLPKNFAFEEFASVAEPSEVIANEWNGRLEYYTAVFRRDGA